MMRKFDDFNDRHGKNNPHVHDENYYFDKTSADESLVKNITFVVPDENYKIYDTIIGESLADLYSVVDSDTLEMSEEDTMYSDGRKGTFVTISFKLKPDVRRSDYEYALDYFFEGIEEAFSAFDISYDNFFPEKEDKEVETSATEQRVYAIKIKDIDDKYDFDFVDACFEIAQLGHDGQEIKLQTALKTIADIAEEQGNVWTVSGFMTDFNFQHIDVRPVDYLIYIGDAIK